MVARLLGLEEDYWEYDIFIDHETARADGKDGWLHLVMTLIHEMRHKVMNGNNPPPPEDEHHTKGFKPSGIPDSATEKEGKEAWVKGDMREAKAAIHDADTKAGRNE